MFIFLRAETYPNESRSPLSPDDVKRLIANGCSVWVQSSATRIFANSEFEEVGATITELKWHDMGSDALIVGLKELANLEKLQNHTHIYFSHSYKGQINARSILDAFSKSGSILYDLEYFLKSDGSRALAFGFYAGLVGGVLGLRQNYNQMADICELKPWDSLVDMMDFPRDSSPLRCAVIGNGRTSQGVQHVLRECAILHEVIRRGAIVNAYDYDIIFNCINLEEAHEGAWVEPGHTKELLIVDISCDYAKPNNPFPIYKEATTWSRPVFHYSDAVSIIAIDNLPSLLPRDSSAHFSKLLTELLLQFGNASWIRNLAAFHRACVR
jgi:saccharopine dehydrogenase (NAD+, L-lysine forming)